ncbi:MAG TPA: hypothetical protein VIY56_01950, partial [Vicinamibacterales bacterium]
MTDERDEGPLDPRIKELAQEYHLPPALDREALWTRVQARRQSTVDNPQSAVSPQPAGERRLARGSRRPVMSTRAAAWITGIAALLVIGI